MTTPKIAQKGPYNVQLEEGKRYHWCACGHSSNQPFCDGSHKGTGITPLAFTAEKTEEAHLCGCKQTKNPPFCDGTHNNL
jgi:CDGSH-type Zn-finger protein